MLQAAAQAEPFKQAEVTKTVNIVSLLPEMQSPRAATIGDIISGRTALTTADASRAELQFPDLTLTRVGANALFRFYAGGRDMVLDGGTMLFYSPRGAGGGKVQAGAITAAVTGTDFLVSVRKGACFKRRQSQSDLPESHRPCLLHRKSQGTPIVATGRYG